MILVSPDSSFAFTLAPAASWAVKSRISSASSESPSRFKVAGTDMIERTTPARECTTRRARATVVDAMRARDSAPKRARRHLVKKPTVQSESTMVSRAASVLLLLVAATESALAPGDAVGVCLTGMERTLLEAPVVASFDKYVRRPVVAAGATLDAFVVLADGAGTPLGVAEHEGRERHREHRGEALFADIRAAYGAVSARALGREEDPKRADRDRCLPTDEDLAGRRTRRSAVMATLEQFVGIRACFRDVLRREAAKRRPVAATVFDRETNRHRRAW